MKVPYRHVVIFVSLGVLLSAGFALANTAHDPQIKLVDDVIVAPLPKAMPQAFDTSTLVKFKGDTYRIDYDAGISSDVLSTTVITKIEAGRVSYVTVGVTNSGTYSSEGLMSPHVRYPGVQVTRVANQDGAVASLERRNWQPLSLANANSFIQVARN